MSSSMRQAIGRRKVTSSSLKYFIMPNKRRGSNTTKSTIATTKHNNYLERDDEKQFKCAFYCFSIVVVSIFLFFCLNQQVYCTQLKSTSSQSNDHSIDQARRLNEAGQVSSASPRSSSAPTAARLPGRQVKLEGERAMLKCSLRPRSQSASARRRRQVGVSLMSDKDARERRKLANPADSGVIDGLQARASRRVLESEFEPEVDDADQLVGEESPSEGDAVELILWYHAGPHSQAATVVGKQVGAHLQPIYSVDARGSSFKQAAQSGNSTGSELVPVKSIAETNKLTHKERSTLIASLMSKQVRHYAQAALSSRIKLSIQPNESAVYLIIDQLKLADAGHYKCRVDFRFARTSYQVNQLDVIAPVTQVQIRAGSDLWAPVAVERAAVGANSGLEVQYNGEQIFAGGKESELLQCRTLDGWPSAELAWWRLDWTPEASTRRAHFVTDHNANGSSSQTSTRLFGHLRLTRFTSEPINSPARLRVARFVVANTVEPLRLEQQQEEYGQNQDQDKEPYLISANTIDFQLNFLRAAGESKLLALPVHSANLQSHNQLKANANNNGPSSLHVAKVGAQETNKSEPSRALSFLEKMDLELVDSLRERLASLVLSTARQDTQQSKRLSLAPLDTQLFSLASDSPSPRLWPRRSASQADVSVAHEKTGEDDELWKLFCHTQLVLYTCGASNTKSLPAELLASTEQLLSEEQRDKLASVRPVFSSLIGKPNVRPKWIRLFLVNRRRRSLSSGKNSEQIELTSLRSEQSLHLNLATSSASSASTADDGAKSEEAQLHFACQVSGSQPEANIEWSAHRPSSINDFSSLNENELELVSVSDTETLELVETANLNGEGAAIEAADKTRERGQEEKKKPQLSMKCQADEDKTQWSSLRLRNISVLDHYTVIECSASNPKFKYSQSVKSEITKLSSRIRLNITHVPLVNLELELTNLQEKTGTDEAVNYTKTSNANQLQLQNEESRQSGWSDALIGSKNEIKTIVYGENVTLVCNVNFANPPIIKPVEWSLNDTKQFDTATTTTTAIGRSLLVHVLGKEPGTASRQHQFIERLIVQFSTTNTSKQSRSQSKESQLLQLKCSAQNALGRAVSKTLKLVIGQPPYCLAGSAATLNDPALDRKGKGRDRTTTTTTTSISKTEPKSDKRASLQLLTTTTATTVNSNATPTEATTSPDKDQSVHCPVISDKSSSTFRWLTQEQVQAQAQKSRVQVQGQTTINNSVRVGANETLISSSSPVILMSKLDPTRPDAKFVSGFYYCYASDKFGSNDKSPCMIRLISSLADTREDTYNCSAWLTSRKSSPLGEDPSDGQHPQSASLADPPTNKVLVSLECKDNQHKFFPNKLIRSGQKDTQGDTLTDNNDYDDDDDDKPVEDDEFRIDLYRKSDGKFVKHLASQPVHWKSSNPRLSLTLDLGAEFEFFTSHLNGSSFKDLEDKYFIIMSSNEVINKRQSNISLYFNAYNYKVSYSNQEQQQQQQKLADNFSRTSESSGHQDRLWVIKSLAVALLLSSFVLIIIGWVCRSTSSKSNSSLKDKAQGLGNGSSASAASNQCCKSSELQTEMYLLRDDDDDDDWTREQLIASSSSMDGIRPAVYHKHSPCQTTSKTFLSSTKETTAHCKSTTIQTRSNPCDFLIIDPTPIMTQTAAPVSTPGDIDRLSVVETVVTNNKQQQTSAAAILLIDSPPETDTTTCTIKHFHHHHHPDLFRPSGRPDICSEDAISRLQFNFPDEVIPKMRRSNSQCANCISPSPSCCTNHQYHRCHHQQQQQQQREQINLGKDVNGYRETTFELNSLGELTGTTDESWSSSFMHDELPGVREGNQELRNSKQHFRLNQTTQANRLPCCSNCLYGQQQITEKDEQQATRTLDSSGLLAGYNQTVPSLNVSFLNSPFISTSSSTTQSSSSPSTLQNGQQHSTRLTQIRRNNKNRPERVRFVEEASLT